MLTDFNGADRVYIVCGYTDLRRGIDGLASLVQQQPFVINRKNFLFANTPRGAKSSAVTFSLIQTAVENGLESYRYLTWLLSSATEMDPAQSQNAWLLLPWNAPDSCKP